MAFLIIIAILSILWHIERMNYIAPPPNNHRTRLQDGGRLVIPAEFRKALDLAAGEEMIVKLEGEELRIYPARLAVDRLQQLVRKHSKLKRKGKSAVDELIAERRREAKRELEQIRTR
jgi:AbrB family looped-hinge helix DNA binding protein